MTITQGVITPDGEASELDPMEVEVAVWAIPWPQLLIVLALALMITGLFWGRRRRTKQIEHLVDQAREAGRREAEQTVSAGGTGGTGAESPVAEVQR